MEYDDSCELEVVITHRNKSQITYVNMDMLTRFLEWIFILMRYIDNKNVSPYSLFFYNHGLRKWVFIHKLRTNTQRNLFEI